MSKKTIFGGVKSGTVPAGAGLYYDSTGALVSGNAPNPGNIAPNGNFEILDGSGNPVAWTLSNTGAVSTTSPLSGSYCIESSPGGSPSIIANSAKTDCIPGESYFAQIFGRSDSGTTGIVFLYVISFDASGAQVGSSFQTGAITSSTWSSGNVQFTIASGVSSFAYQVQTQKTSGSGKVYFDGVACLNTIISSYIAPNAIAAANMQASSITAANNALAANAVVDSNVASVGVSKLISGTVIFTGDVVMSRGTGNPVIDISNSGLFLFGVASGSTGVFTDPYVVIQSGGILVYGGGSGGTGPAVVVNGSSIVLYKVNGSFGSPNLQISGSGLVISDGGSTNLSANSGSITITNGANQFSVSSSGLVLSNPGAGMNLTLSASGIVLSNGSGPTITISGSTGSIAAMTLSLTSSGLTTQVNNATRFGNSTGIVTSDGSYMAALGPAFFVCGNAAGSSTIWDMEFTGTAGNEIASLKLFNNSLTTLLQMIAADSATANAGGAVLPATPQGFLQWKWRGATAKIPYYLN